MKTCNEKNYENQRLFLGVHYYRVTFYSKNVLIRVHKDFPFIEQIGPKVIEGSIDIGLLMLIM